MKKRITLLLLCLLLWVPTITACARKNTDKQPVPEATSGTEAVSPTKPEKAQKPGHGSAAYINGRTLVVSIFADDAVTQWDQKKDADIIGRTQEHLRIATEWLTNAVKPYGAKDEFLYDWKENPDLRYNAKFTETLVRDDGSMYDVQADYIRKNVDAEALKAKYHADNVAYFFFFNTSPENAPTPWTLGRISGEELQTEFVNLFVRGADVEEEPPSTYAHEMLHAFGAPDLYYAGGLIPQAYVDHCEETDSQDIMYTVNGEMDRITGQLTDVDAYYLGLVPRPAEADQWKLGLSEYEGE